ncbi:MAG: hypothetical protein Kow0056_12540 [Coriobacteriia bacterium]
MSQATLQPNKTILALVAVILLLVAVIAGVLVAKSGDVPGPDSAATSAGTSGVADAGGAQAGGVAPPAADFDPTTATKVPADVTPEDFVAGYYEAVLAGDWEEAYSRQPAARQTGDVDGFAQQIQGYGVVGYEITGATQQGDQYMVTVDQQTAQYGTFVNQWVFYNHEGEWVVQDKAVTGMK